MAAPTTRVLALLLVASAAVIHGAQTPARPAAPRPSGPMTPPVRSAADEMKTFSMADGYRVDLVASEPLIQDPILVDWDPSGRLWAIEMPSYMNDLAGTGEQNPTGRIVVLEDTDNDGVMDKRTVFADGLVLPRALRVLDHGVLVGEPPNLWLMRDTNGDLKADTKTLVTDQFGRRDADVEHNANGLMWALDNWMYTSETDIYLRLKHGEFEVRKTLPRGQWGATQDDAGRVYRNTNESVLHVDVVPTPYYARYPNLLRTRGSYESLEGDNREVNTVWPAHPTPAVNRGYQNGILRADGSLAAYTSVNSPLVYRGDRLPKDVYGSVFVAEPAGNLVSRIIVEDDGESFESRKADENREFLTSSDERFRPVYLSNAPDGTLYIVDMYRGIIEHKSFVTEYLRDQTNARKLEPPTGRGRIFRVMHTTTQRGPKPALASASPAELVAALSHPNGWWRDTAQRLLVERDDKSIVPALVDLARSAPLARTRLQALWILDGIDAITPDLVVGALDDRDRDVRVSALRLAERWLPEPNPTIQQAVVRRLDDQDWLVREQVAATFGSLVPNARVPAMALLLERHGDDPITVDAAISGLRGQETAVVEKLLAAGSSRPMMIEPAVSMLTATVIRGGDDKAAAALLAWTAEEARPAWQRAALMQGAEIALLASPMPGSRGSGRAATAGAAPCPTCAGARGGPGSAYAFPEGRGAAAAPAAGRGANGGPRLRLTAEPVAFEALAAANNDLGARAARVLARVDWAAKPGAPQAPAALTPEEQQRFTAGEQVYKNLCQACHQPNGQGQERMGASLVASAFALAAPDIPARIVINGKVGSVGWMPPLASTLTDDQIAGALTYIRRQWGNNASAVDPAVVKQIRALTVSHTGPWTEDELKALMK